MPPPNSPIFFIDRSLGRKVVAEALIAHGEQVVIHDDEFSQSTSDIAWLSKVGAKGWVVLTKDARIRTNALERQALLNANVAAFMLARGDLSGNQMAAAFLLGLKAIKKTLSRDIAPFIATVNTDGKVHLHYSQGALLRPSKIVKG